MNSTISKTALVALVLAIIACVVPFVHFGDTRLGGVTNYDEVDATAIKIGGTSGSRVGPVIATTCTILADVSVTASTTKNFDCAVTGVVSGDTVFATLQASSTLASQYLIKGVTASSTSGWITFSLYNATGGSAIPAATNGFGSSTQVLILHPVSSVPGL